MVRGGWLVDGRLLEEGGSFVQQPRLFQRRCAACPPPKARRRPGVLTRLSPAPCPLQATEALRITPEDLLRFGVVSCCSCSCLQVWSVSAAHCLCAGRCLLQ